MKRYWFSWWSGGYPQEGCSTPPFTPFISGSQLRGDGWSRYSLCQVFDAPSPAPIWALVAKHYPDYEPRFCEERPADWLPGDRFPGAGAYVIEEKPMPDPSQRVDEAIIRPSLPDDLDVRLMEWAERLAPDFKRRNQAWASAGGVPGIEDIAEALRESFDRLDSRTTVVGTGGLMLEYFPDQEMVSGFLHLGDLFAGKPDQD